MKLTQQNALRIWAECYGDSEFAKDFHGNLMCRDAYGNSDFYIRENGQRIYCGWNLHHILPKAHGGSNAPSNLICTNILTNEAAESKITYWIDDSLYQVRKIYGSSNHEIVRLA